MQVDVPSFSGSFGILPSHVASLAVLKPGVVTVYEDDGATKKFFVSSGSITINDDSSVQILAEEAHAVEDLDAAAAKAALAEVSADDIVGCETKLFFNPTKANVTACAEALLIPQGLDAKHN